MKPEQYYHQPKRGTVIRVLCFILGVLVLSMLLVSCAKKAEQAKANPNDESGVNITSEPAQSLPGRVVQRAMGTKCEDNIKQLRMLIDIYKGDNDGKYPPTLMSIPEAARIARCPISHKDYTYDASTGQVHCTFSGHEGY